MVGQDAMTLLMEGIEIVDAHLDAEVAEQYKAQPLARDWARVAKAGEAIDAFIRWTGENPRKGVCGTRDELLGELADVATAGLYAIQHFTKDSNETMEVLLRAVRRHVERVVEHEEAK